MRAAVLCLAMLVALSGCASATQPPGVTSASGVESPRAAGPKRIAAAALGEPATLSAKVNAVQIPAPGADALEELVNAGVAYGDDRGGLSPQLAEAVPTLENGLWKLLPDGRMETTWRLKPAQWHDGAAFTADDVVFSARLGMDRELAVFRDAAFDVIEGVDRLDARTVVARWTQPFIEADLTFTKSLFARHILERPYTDDKASFTQLSYWNQEFVGLGPYKLREWAVGSRMVLEAFDQYVMGRPKIDEIEVRFISDPSTVIANILAGSVDLTFGRGLSVEQAILVRDQWREGRRAGVHQYLAHGLSVVRQSESGRDLGPAVPQGPHAYAGPQRDSRERPARPGTGSPQLPGAESAAIPGDRGAYPALRV